jgi:aminopeptidase 2
LNPQDRLGIIRDLFALAEAGESDVTHALLMLQSYKKEKEYIVWVEIISGFSSLNNLLYGSKSQELLRTYARDILSEIIKHVGWEPQKDESHNDALLRTLVLSAGAAFGNTEVIAEAKKRFEQRKEKPIPADFRGIIYATVVREGGLKEYNEIKALYQKETLHEEKDRLLGALCASRDEKILQQSLAFIRTDEVRLQDKVSAYALVLINPRGRILGWKFIKKNWKKIVKEYGEGNHMLASIVSVLNRNTTDAMYDDIKMFFKKNPVSGAERTLLQTLERIDSNISWRARDEKKIFDFLSK